MIQSREDLRFYMHEDAKCAGLTSSFKYYTKLIYGSEDAHILRYLKILRKYEFFHNSSKTIVGKLLCYFYRFRWMRLSLRYNIRIGRNMVGYGFRIVHLFGGVLINCKSMGNYCRVNGGVIVGVKGDASAAASIGNNVSLNAGAKVFGKISIGNNVVVATNAVVLKNVPDNCTVAGVPAKIIEREGVKKDVKL